MQIEIQFQTLCKENCAMHIWYTIYIMPAKSPAQSVSFTARVVLRSSYFNMVNVLNGAKT